MPHKIENRCVNDLMDFSSSHCGLGVGPAAGFREIRVQTSIRADGKLNSNRSFHLFDWDGVSEILMDLLSTICTLEDYECLPCLSFRYFSFVMIGQISTENWKIYDYCCSLHIDPFTNILSLSLWDIVAWSFPSLSPSQTPLLLQKSGTSNFAGIIVLCFSRRFLCFNLYSWLPTHYPRSQIYELGSIANTFC